MKKQVAIGLIGTTLDRARGRDRWDHWRPTVALCQHEDLLLDRLDLLHQNRFASLAKQVTEDIRGVSPETEVRCHPIEFGDPWDFQEVYAALHDFSRAYPFDPEAEDYLVHITTGTHVAQICLFLLTEARYIPGRLVQTAPPGRKEKDAGPGSYVTIDLDLSKYDRIAARFEQEARDDISFLKSGIETRNATFNALIERIERVALRSRDPILLTGPTGAGKSLLARRIFELRKARRQLTGPFVEVNCATLRGDAAMSALFGHEKGAFTGALQRREGLLRAADGGMLFLDEVGELGLDEQAMLLRAIEEKRFLPLGSDQEAASDFLLICGTNQDLPSRVQEGVFREDLLARLNLWTFRLPGLSERREDIPPNIDFELDGYAERNGAHVSFNREARARFQAFAVSPEAAWRANFRDLNAAVTRMATLAPGGRITTIEVDDELSRLREAWARADADPDQKILDNVLGRGEADALDRFDRVQLADVLRVCAASRSLSAAGRELFAASRERRTTTNDADRLRKYLARFNLSWQDVNDAQQQMRTRTC